MEECPLTSKELVARYQAEEGFRQRVDKAEREYHKMLRKAQQRSLDIPEQICERFLKAENQAVYFFYGFMQPTPCAMTSELALAIVKYLRPEPHQQYTLVYFNNCTPSSGYFFEFKRCLGLLPYSVTEGLRLFLLVKPYFYIRAFDFVGLGSLSRLVASQYRTLGSCHDLVELLKVPVQSFVSFVPEELSEEFPRALKKRPSLVSYRQNVLGQSLTEEQKKEKSEFELGLKALITKEVFRLEDYEQGDLGIPVMLQLLVHYFRTKPEGLDEEGIFRKSVSVDEEEETLQELSRGNYEHLEHLRNPHLVASLIKRFFSNLKEPVVPFVTYAALLKDQGVRDRVAHVRTHLRTIPELNWLTLAYLMEFLKQDVLPHHARSKMTAHNLAICFSPSLMRSEKVSMADLLNASKAVAITSVMLGDLDEVFGSQEQRTALFKRKMRTADKGFGEAVRRELEISTIKPEHDSLEQSADIEYRAPTEEEFFDISSHHSQDHGPQQPPPYQPAVDSRQEDEARSTPGEKQGLIAVPASLKVPGQVRMGTRSEGGGDTNLQQVPGGLLAVQGIQALVRFTYGSRKQLGP